ncbi:hypothetical protein MYX77_07310 [Acidobacteriia bacterium AH_259_A11_L15]|nr:hypothetical protein [Acidobacteriia bacterium AH_259_A11_L15]
MAAKKKSGKRLKKGKKITSRKLQRGGFGMLQRGAGVLQRGAGVLQRGAGVLQRGGINPLE